MHTYDSEWQLATRLIHAGERAAPPVATPTATPVYTSTTYLFPDAESIDRAFETGAEFVYNRYGNPTVSAFEAAMTAAERAVSTVAFSSGMAALHVALLAASTPRGATHPQIGGIVAARDLYGATTKLIEEFFASQGAQVAYVDMCDLAEVEAAIEAIQPSVVICEQISNPLLRVVDVAGLARLTRAAGARLVVDSTMTTPVLQRPIEQGADLVVHSATKFIGGHGDVTAGVVSARTSLLADTLRGYSRLLGAILGPAEAALTLRGLKTLALRVRQQSANALAVARWLTDQPQVSQVYYPGLPNHPQHQLATEVFGGLYGALVSFDLREGTRAAAVQTMNRFRLILCGTTLGDLYTQVTAPLLSSHRSITAEQRAERGIGDGMLRLSIGIEDAADLISDLAQAIAV